MPSEIPEIDIHVTSPNQVNGSILIEDFRDDTRISNLPSEKAVILEFAIKYGLPMDTFEQLREEMFEVWRAVLFANGYTAEEISKLINQVKKSKI